MWLTRVVCLVLYPKGAELTDLLSRRPSAQAKGPPKESMSATMRACLLVCAVALSQCWFPRPTVEGLADKDAHPRSPTPPHVFVESARIAGDSALLTCRALNFYPIKINFRWEIDGAPVPTWYPGALVFEDGTYQGWSTIKVPKDSATRFTCVVTHSSLNGSLTVRWQPGATGASARFIVALVCTLLGISVLLGILALVYHRQLARRDVLQKLADLKEPEPPRPQQQLSGSQPRWPCLLWKNWRRRTDRSPTPLDKC
ncbi:MHC Class I [Eptesicus fuscus gammaherpesvirus]|uniref:IgG receptor FcRn large subunit p51 n=1 Tax=vespertilionid gammaherpesvirus 3 TaxID=2846598 RepID=A0A2D1AEV9_9GAMA|nr:MHC Class I [Eptesicus fuscus gammaherpesvirus]ATA58232.1 MHC Class I [Eptesicus fuscus gammaherpesvirus]WAH70956.1 H-2 class I histocompatibility antigen [Eptesicus fuscus gammaherpesvirus]